MRFGDVIAWIAVTFAVVGLVASLQLRRELRPKKTGPLRRPGMTTEIVELDSSRIPF
jgi:hypothetical protein